MKVEVQYPGLCRETTPAGIRRWRVRVEGENSRKITIPVGPGHVDFQDCYEAARSGQKLQCTTSSKPVRGTLDELSERFLVWMEGQVATGKLSAATLDSRKRGLSQARETLAPNRATRVGELNANLPREAFVHIADAFGAKTAAAATCLKALRAAYKWGADRGFPTRSEVFGVSANHQPGTGALPWTSIDIQKFLDRHPPGSMARLWFCLAFPTASRIGDAPFLGPENEVVYDGVRHLEWQPLKKGSKPVSIPMHDMLAHELKHHTVGATYLINAFGVPFASSGSLDNRVRKWIIQACLYDEVLDENGTVQKKANRSQHGIRKGVAQLLAEGGASKYEIMAVLAHSEAKTTERYTEHVDRRFLAKKAAEKRKVYEKRYESGPRPQ